MPPFREGPIKIDRRLSGDALKFLREVGHGHRINIVDASYDIPNGLQVIDFPGTTAEAFNAVCRLIPIENEDIQPDVVAMEADKELVDAKGALYVNVAAKGMLEIALSSLQKNKTVQGNWSEDIEFATRYDSAEGDKGFYTIANNPDQHHTFIRTQDDLPFACVSLVVGHSQRTR